MAREGDELLPIGEVGGEPVDCNRYIVFSPDSLAFSCSLFQSTPAAVMKCMPFERRQH